MSDLSQIRKKQTEIQSSNNKRSLPAELAFTLKSNYPAGISYQTDTSLVRKLSQERLRQAIWSHLDPPKPIQTCKRFVPKDPVEVIIL